MKTVVVIVTGILNRLNHLGAPHYNFLDLPDAEKSGSSCYPVSDVKSRSCEILYEANPMKTIHRIHMNPQKIKEHVSRMLVG